MLMLADTFSKYAIITQDTKMVRRSVRGCGTEVVVELNVGGTRLCASLATLRHFPESRLAKTVTSFHNDDGVLEHFSPLSADAQGRLFVDRDPGAFAVILNFLRLHKEKQRWQSCLPKGEDDLARVIQEAEYWGLDLLKNEATTLLGIMPQYMDDNFLHYRWYFQHAGENNNWQT